tara:strand:+ start:418 stop:588 length:171 start_codon:yes stop_codon:yes gene_type:complete
MELIVDLDWEYDRMSESGKETYDELCKLLGIEEPVLIQKYRDKKIEEHATPFSVNK